MDSKVNSKADLSQAEYLIILYYKYVAIEKPEVLMTSQRTLCERLNLKGRIIISQEGINGTLEGKREDIEKYCAELTADPRFAETHFKKSAGGVGVPAGQAFPRLSVKLRNEIVSGHLKEKSHTGDIDPTRLTGTRLSPDQLRSWFEQGRDFVIVDMRNEYEHEVGHFKGSLLPEMENFRDLPQALKKLEEKGAVSKDKTVLTVCTGGVRCEKASGYLVKNGFQDVYQLDGGIVSYMEKYPGKDFQGSLYVFDGRVTMHFDTPEQHTVIGKCAHCGSTSENYADCRIDECHAQFICCKNCLDNEGRAFCKKCKNFENLVVVAK